MSVISWLAKRNLAAGSSVDDQNEIEFVADPSLDPTISSDAVHHTSINRNRVVVLRSVYRVWSVTCVISNAQYELFQEFVASVAAGEPFEFDAYGTIASPDDPVSMQLTTPNLANQARRWAQSTADFSVSMSLEEVGSIT